MSNLRATIVTCYTMVGSLATFYLAVGLGLANSRVDMSLCILKTATTRFSDPKIRASIYYDTEVVSFDSRQIQTYYKVYVS